MLFPSPGYLKQLKESAHKHGALFIVDEAQTGFGRTGKWFAIEHHGVEPDILSLSKSVGNGFPASAVITTAEIANKVVADGLWNLSSHQCDPVTAAAVCAVIDTVREENLVERARESGDYFMQQLRDLSARQPIIRNVRGLGLMIGFDIATADPDTAVDAANCFMYGCRRRGLHLTYGYGSVNFRIIPPLVITPERNRLCNRGDRKVAAGRSGQHRFRKRILAQKPAYAAPFRAAPFAEDSEPLVAILPRGMGAKGR